MATPKERAAIYRKAAGLITTWQWACHAIEQAATGKLGGDPTPAEVEAYFTLFAPDDHLGSWTYRWVTHDEERAVGRDAAAVARSRLRELSLLFAAAMAETGDL